MFNVVLFTADEPSVKTYHHAALLKLWNTSGGVNYKSSRSAELLQATVFSIPITFTQKKLAYCFNYNVHTCSPFRTITRAKTLRFPSTIHPRTDFLFLSPVRRGR